MNNLYVEAFVGGMLIGLGAILLMLLNGRIAGISGIVNGALSGFSVQTFWRWAFILGLVVAPFVASITGFTLPTSLPVDTATLVIAGLIVGVGTQIGSGCTSGHGICGIGRLSKRSIVATMIFMGSAITTVAITNLF
ncbi:YeeE/YedE family protein [Paraglaciecola aquimarina]|uniref:YeeE/YedE family protein n=1 Tax=Paraglaciecola algarum TaxID=3050085 RepID=A0ABS9DDD4_9ALTE|nr:YeeE/YedE family protein [Paraglaciecola sp. G1-23]MCF2950003.1 YeeE/YedE family protein [Paraglaciecola sp. G1-23]